MLYEVITLRTPPGFGGIPGGGDRPLCRGADAPQGVAQCRERHGRFDSASDVV